MKKSLSLLLLILICSGCSPKYQQGNVVVGGYTNNKLGERIYQIAYTPGLFLNEKDLSKKDLVIIRRASELTLENGFSHFTRTLNSLTNGITIHLYKESDEDLPSQAISAKDFLAYNS